MLRAVVRRLSWDFCDTSTRVPLRSLVPLFDCDDWRVPANCEKKEKNGQRALQGLINLSGDPHFAEVPLDDAVDLVEQVVSNAVKEFGTAELLRDRNLNAITPLLGRVGQADALTLLGRQRFGVPDDLPVFNHLPTSFQKNLIVAECVRGNFDE